MRKLAIIPARGGSKRLPHKNIRNFMGQPIIGFPLKAAAHSKLFDEIMVSTDDEEIADIGKHFGASIPFMRSAENATDLSTTADVLLEVLKHYQKRGISFSHACCIYPTSPLISKFDLRSAYSKMMQENFDSVVSVTKYSYPIQRALEINSDGQLSMSSAENKNIRTQDLNENYHDAGQFYWFDVKKFLEHKTLFTPNSGALILPEQNVQDIDNESDWKMAEMKFKLQNRFYETEPIYSS